jgi:hypothetical protein
MAYDEFVKEYERLVKILLSYENNQIGFEDSNVYYSKLADLVEEYPKYEQVYDATPYDPQGFLYRDQ